MAENVHAKGPTPSRYLALADKPEQNRGDVKRDPCLTLQAVRGFALPPASAAAHIAALTELSKPAAASEDSKPETADWGCAVLKAAEEVLGGFVEQVNRTRSAC